MLLDGKDAPILDVRTITYEERRCEDGCDFVARRTLRAPSDAALQAQVASARVCALPTLGFPRLE